MICYWKSELCSKDAGSVYRAVLTVDFYTYIELIRDTHTPFTWPHILSAILQPSAVLT